MVNTVINIIIIIILFIFPSDSKKVPVFSTFKPHLPWASLNYGDHTPTNAPAILPLQPLLCHWLSSPTFRLVLNPQNITFVHCPPVCIVLTWSFPVAYNHCIRLPGLPWQGLDDWNNRNVLPPIWSPRPRCQQVWFLLGCEKPSMPCLSSRFWWFAGSLGCSSAWRGLRFTSASIFTFPLCVSVSKFPFFFLK